LAQLSQKRRPREGPFFFPSNTRLTTFTRQAQMVAR
jgi:hypothetical protein